MLAGLAEEHSVDFIVLAESDSVGPTAVLKAINDPIVRFWFHPSPASRLAIFSALPTKSVVAYHDARTATIRRVRHPLIDEFLLVAVHLNSKLRLKTEDQVELCRRIPTKIQQAEEHFGHDRTIVIGDFNMNPFERGLLNFA